MAVSFPRTDILSAAFVDQNFRLVSRQELSTQSSGVVRGKDLGSAIWMADYTTIAMDNDDAIAYEAALNSLDGVIFPFEAGDLRRPYPRAHADGVFNDAGVLASINANNKALTISGLDAGFQISVGDYFTFVYGTSVALHQAVEAAVADGSGLTPLFEVRPHIRPGWDLDPATPVTFKLPRAQMTLLPGSMKTSMQQGIFTSISFQAVQYL